MNMHSRQCRPDPLLGPLGQQSTNAPDRQPHRQAAIDASARVNQLIGMLRSFQGDSVAAWAAEGFEAWLSQGGDLQSHLDLRPRRGGAKESPQAAIRLQKRDNAIRELASNLGVSNAPMAIAEMVKTKHHLVVTIREEAGVAVPASVAQLKRIIRDH